MLTQADTKGLAIEFVMLVIYSLATVLFSVMSTVDQVSEMANEELAKPEHIVVLADSMLRTACLIGSLCGAVAAVWIFPSSAKTSKDAIREVLGNGFVSVLCGAMLTPMVARWSQLQIDIDFVGMVAFAVSLVSVSVLKKVAPYFVECLSWLGKKKIDETIRKDSP